MGHLRQVLMSLVKESFKAAALSSLFPLQQKKSVSMNEHPPEGDVRAVY